jgi:hypothetical protein
MWRGHTTQLPCPGPMQVTAHSAAAVSSSQSAAPPACDVTAESDARARQPSAHDRAAIAPFPSPVPPPAAFHSQLWSPWQPPVLSRRPQGARWVCGGRRQPGGRDQRNCPRAGGCGRAAAADRPPRLPPPLSASHSTRSRTSRRRTLAGWRLSWLRRRCPASCPAARSLAQRSPSRAPGSRAACT